jgi:hypothetical protein
MKMMLPSSTVLMLFYIITLQSQTGSIHSPPGVALAIKETKITGYAQIPG